MTNELMKHEEGNPSQLIKLALDKNSDPATLSKLMDLQERWEAGRARKAYVQAMSVFKQESPAVLKKSDKVDFSTARGHTAYNYANLGSIVQEITTLLGKHELSVSWNTAQDEKNNVTVTCHITHAGGHRESVTLTGPADDSGNKNRIQAVGSTVTYLERYTLLAALGLATGEGEGEGEDDDGQGGAAHKPAVTQPQAKPAPAPAPEKSTVRVAEAELGLYEDMQLVSGFLEKVTVKNGENKKGPWMGTYAKLTGDEAIYSTFSTELGPHVSALEGQKVTLGYKKEGKYLTLHSIEAIDIGSGDVEDPF